MIQNFFNIYYDVDRNDEKMWDKIIKIHNHIVWFNYFSKCLNEYELCDIISNVELPRSIIKYLGKFIQNGMYIAGGNVCNYIQTGEWNLMRDFDLYITKDYKDIKELVEYLRSGKFSETINCINVEINFNIKLQLIKYKYSSPLDIIINYDMDPCRCYYDLITKKIYSVFTNRLSHKYKFNVIDFSDGIIPVYNRINKYNDYGFMPIYKFSKNIYNKNNYNFSIDCIENNINDIDKLIIDSTFYEIRSYKFYLDIFMEKYIHPRQFSNDMNIIIQASNDDKYINWLKEFKYHHLYNFKNINFNEWKNKKIDKFKIKYDRLMNIYEFRKERLNKIIDPSKYYKYDDYINFKNIRVIWLCLRAIEMPRFIRYMIMRYLIRAYILADF